MQTGSSQQDWGDWLWRLLLHLLTGVLAVAVHYGLMAVAMAFGLPPLISSALGFVGGALTRFYTAYFHVYSPTTTARAVAPRFVLALAVQFVANLLLLKALLALGLPVWWAQVAATVALALATYVAYRRLVFT